MAIRIAHGLTPALSGAAGFFSDKEKDADRRGAAAAGAANQSFDRKQRGEIAGEQLAFQREKAEQDSLMQSAQMEQKAFGDQQDRRFRSRQAAAGMAVQAAGMAQRGIQGAAQMGQQQSQFDQSMDLREREFRSQASLRAAGLANQSADAAANRNAREKQAAAQMELQREDMRLRNQINQQRIQGQQKVPYYMQNPSDGSQQSSGGAGIDDQSSAFPQSPANDAGFSGSSFSDNLSLNSQMAPEPPSQRVAKAHAELSSASLTPEGNRLAGSMLGDLRAIQSQKSEMRPEQYEGLMDRWMGEYEETNFVSYSKPSPTVQGELGKRVFDLGTGYGAILQPNNQLEITHLADLVSDRGPSNPISPSGGSPDVTRANIPQSPQQASPQQGSQDSMPVPQWEYVQEPGGRMVPVMRNAEEIQQWMNGLPWEKDGLPGVPGGAQPGQQQSGQQQPAGPQARDFLGNEKSYMNYQKQATESLLEQRQLEAEDPLSVDTNISGEDIAARMWELAERDAEIRQGIIQRASGTQGSQQQSGGQQASSQTPPLDPDSASNPDEAEAIRGEQKRQYKREKEQQERKNIGDIIGQRRQSGDPGFMSQYDGLAAQLKKSGHDNTSPEELIHPWAVTAAHMSGQKDPVGHAMKVAAEALKSGEPHIATMSDGEREMYDLGGVSRLFGTPEQVQRQADELPFNQFYYNADGYLKQRRPGPDERSKKPKTGRPAYPTAPSGVFFPY